MVKEKINKQKLLIVDDDTGLQNQLRWVFGDYDVVLAGDRSACINAIRRHEPLVVLLDLGLPPDPTNASEGLAALTEILAIAPYTKVIVVTGNDDNANALTAIASGAYDFYHKPVMPEVLTTMVERAFYVSTLEKENRHLNSLSKSALTGIISTSPEMQKICKIVEKVAPTNASILVLGESGTGKELIAKALHESSPRVDERFVAINCAAIPENLLESELFGYEKGAFTGAAKQTVGKIEYAKGGTLFLDEIGDMPPLLQTKMLRFLQERIIERVGGREEIPVDVRVVCATHQNIDGLIASGEFREDLYYRISEITVNIPPLRERTGDALLLARHFLTKYAKEMNSSVTGLTPEAMSSISQSSWKGNVRELENRVKRAVIMADGKLLTPDDLELIESSAEKPVLVLNLRQARDVAEKSAITNALQVAEKSIVTAAELLGVSRPTLYDLMSKHGIEK